ncbi:hypothetical protein K450DRAFT_276068 [Umbelopsis ramanniana AG]|uniref:Uncharacterized protein n=1 Tax=Umbelopsis ramanniana AG TaxID=1314678 RepID=A0AAD5E178_UMBRA|nr:uncharacterized protein K450DRAFT_276068 [Umbelopsis ramanniana AG]KAI8574929.1 hypothetical protein K450DRAFT_276068 [Umbelopsis ramanniana AG]
MDHASVGIAQAIILILNKAPEVVHALKRYSQAITWTDWPDHIRANSRDWVKDILARVFETVSGNVVPGDLFIIDHSHWGRKQGCILALSAHAGHSTQQYLNCVIVLLATLPRAQRSEKLEKVRNHLDKGFEHVHHHFLDKTQAERNRARREYAIWRDALCEGILRASGLLNLDSYALSVAVADVDHCLNGLLKRTTVTTKDTLLLIDSGHSKQEALPSFALGLRLRHFKYHNNMQHVPDVVARATILVLDIPPKAVHALKRYLQAISWTDWPDHIRPNFRDWMKDILAKIFETRTGGIVLVDLLMINHGHWLRKQGCALALSADTGHSTQQYLSCVIVLLATLGETDRQESLAIVRKHLSRGDAHVQLHFSDKTQVEKDRSHREYQAWRDAICMGIGYTSGRLNLGSDALAVPATEVDRCLNGLLKDTTVTTRDTLLLIEKYKLEPMLKLRRG